MEALWEGGSEISAVKLAQMSRTQKTLCAGLMVNLLFALTANTGVCRGPRQKKLDAQRVAAMPSVLLMLAATTLPC